jgi:formylglycine-generating enzyme
MAWILGDIFRMRSKRHYPEEAPVHRVIVSPFRIDRTPITIAKFRCMLKRPPSLPVEHASATLRRMSGMLSPAAENA